MRWRYDASDIAPGLAIVATFRPFLIDLLRSKLSRRSFNRHRDNLWLIGGEIIRRRLQDPKLKRLPIDTLIRHLVDDNGAPLVWPRSSEAEQHALDATCRQFHRFLNQSTAAQ